jgi:hypothetical protein
VRVIPVLIDGARPLRQQQLPSWLHKLARLNALELSYSRYEYDADRLLDLIQRVLDAAATDTAHQSLSAGNATAPTAASTLIDVAEAVAHRPGPRGTHRPVDH